MVTAMRAKHTILGILVMISGNEKIGEMAATYAPIRQTCPESCALRNGNGCYAEGGNVGLHMRRLQDERYSDLGGDAFAMFEAAAIRDGADELVRSGVKRPLRIHVSGDASTEGRARMLADAAEAWPDDVYTYTHAWRAVPRTAWGRVSVLASVETLAGAKEALRAGYAPAIVVGKHPTDGKARVEDGVKIIPCPSQTRGVTCTDCRLCMRADMLQAQGAAIAFEVHGMSKKRALNVIQG